MQLNSLPVILQINFTVTGNVYDLHAREFYNHACEMRVLFNKNTLLKHVMTYWRKRIAECLIRFFETNSKEPIRRSESDFASLGAAELCKIRNFSNRRITLLLWNLHTCTCMMKLVLFIRLNATVRIYCFCQYYARAMPVSAVMICAVSWKDFAGKSLNTDI